MNDLITVIVPIYNTEKYLQSCIDSICAQTYSRLEIILVDDGSTDNSLSICQKMAKLDSRIRVFHKDNGGVSSARNLGLQEARGKYIGFVDSDDMIAPEMYEKMLICMREYEADIVRVSVVDKKTGTHKVEKERVCVYNQCDAIYELLTDGKIKPGICSKLFCKEVITGIKFDENIHINEDFLFSYKTIKKSSCVIVLNENLYYYRQRMGSCTNGGGLNKKQFDTLIVTNQIVEDTKNDKKLHDAAVYRQIGAVYSLLNRIIEYRQFEECYESLRKIVCDNYFFITSNELFPKKMKLATCIFRYMPGVYRVVIRMRKILLKEG